MEDMIKMLADAPEDQRKAILTERMKMIAAQPEDQRLESVKGIVMAASKLPKDKMNAFIKTRTDAVLDASEDIRRKIVVARAKIGSQIPKEVNEADMMAIVEYMMKWPKEKQDMVISKMDVVYKEAGLPVPDYKSMMEKIKSMT